MAYWRRGGATLTVLVLLAPELMRAQPGGQFLYPISLAVDATSGNVIVSENARHRIDILNSNGVVTFRFGTQGLNDGQFENPAGVAIDAQQAIYVADMRNARVQKFDATGTFLKKWGTLGSGPGQFRKPVAIAVDSQGNVSVLDAETRLIQKFSPDGLTRLGSWGGRTGAGDGEFAAVGTGPVDLAIDPSGFVYVTDPGNQRIQQWRIVSDATTGVIQSATFLGWSGRCTSGANCNIAFQRSNGFTCTAATCSPASGGSDPGQFLNPNGLTLDGAGNLYVADTVNNRIQQFSSTGTYVRQWGVQGYLPGEFRSPVDIAAAPAGHLYVADFQNQRVQKFSTAGPFEGVFGGSISLSAAAGYPPRSLDALVDPNPLFMFSGGSTSTTVRVTSVSSFAGSVTLSAAGCCEDLVTRMGLPGALNATFSPQPVDVLGDGFVDTTLTLSTTSSTPTGRLMVPLYAGNPQLGVSAYEGLAVQVFPPIPSDTGKASSCFGTTGPGLPEVLPLTAVTGAMYRLKASRPAMTTFHIGAKTKSSSAGWEITIERASMPLRPDQSLVILKNTTSWDKGISTVNSATCLPAGQSIRLGMNQTGSLLISTADTSSLVFNRQVCKTRILICYDNSGWQGLAMFDEGAFWSLFGGRQVTINWFFSQFD